MSIDETYRAVVEAVEKKAWVHQAVARWVTGKDGERTRLEIGTSHGEISLRAYPAHLHWVDAVRDHVSLSVRLPEDASAERIETAVNEVTEFHRQRSRRASRRSQAAAGNRGASR